MYLLCIQGQSNVGNASLSQLNHDWKSIGHQDNGNHCNPSRGSGKPLELSAWPPYNEALDCPAMMALSSLSNVALLNPDVDIDNGCAQHMK